MSYPVISPGKKVYDKRLQVDSLFLNKPQRYRVGLCNVTQEREKKTTRQSAIVLVTSENDWGPILLGLSEEPCRICQVIVQPRGHVSTGSYPLLTKELLFKEKLSLR